MATEFKDCKCYYTVKIQGEPYGQVTLDGEAYQTLLQKGHVVLAALPKLPDSIPMHSDAVADEEFHTVTLRKRDVSNGTFEAEVVCGDVTKLSYWRR